MTGSRSSPLPRSRARRSRVLARGRAAFTLIEVAVAALIVGLTLAAVATVMRTAARAWRSGRGAGEIFQTARIAQDVLRRDLDNMLYLSAVKYNKTYRSQLEALDRQRLQNPASQDELDTKTLAPPIDLALRGADGGKTDTLAFARGFRPRQEGDAPAAGIQRVSYSIRGKVLYRAQSDAFAPAESRDGAATPALPRIEEPLCEGVEIFDATYGYFKDGAWVEVKDWDSGQCKHRNPPPDSPNPEAIPNASPQAIAAASPPDDLPGYLAIQIGVRSPTGQGRMRSFTVFHALPVALETDIDRGNGHDKGRGKGIQRAIAQSGRPAARRGGKI